MRSPIEVGSVVRQVFDIYVEQAPVLMPAAAVVFVITGILTELLVATGSGGLALLALVISLIATTLFTGMVVVLVADVQDGRRDFTVSQMLSAVTPVLSQLIIVALVTGVLEAIGFLLLIIPGLILFTLWAVVAPVVVIERPGRLRSLARSRELVSGNSWQVFGVVLVLLIGVVIASLVLESAAAAAGTAVGLVVRVVVGILAAPLPALAASVLYFRLRHQPAGGGSTDGGSMGSFPTGSSPPTVS